MNSLLDLIGPLVLLDYVIAALAILSFGCMILFSSHHVWSEKRDTILEVQRILLLLQLILYWLPFLKFIPYEYPKWFVGLVFTNRIVDTAAMVVGIICVVVMLRLDNKHYSKDSKAGIHRAPKERNEKTEYQKVADGYNR